MPATNPKPAAPMPASPRNTAKYTNKDGSKFITVPTRSASDSSQPPTPTTTGASQPPAPPTDTTATTVNRKKQKRRQKAAARAAAAEEAANGHVDVSAGQAGGNATFDDQDGPASDDDAEEYAVNGGSTIHDANGHPASSTGKAKKNKKKKKGIAIVSSNADQSPTVSNIDGEASSDMPRISGMSKDKIWSTSNQEERERIKEFWLGLGEDDRKSLVKVEKDAVLRKMKEQQKHTCSCTVCGRKRTAIEEELEGLYDAYYLELEQFANQGEGPPMLPPPPRDFPSRPPRRLPSAYAPHQPSRGRIVEHVADDDEEDDLDETYSEDEIDDEEYSDEEPPEQYQTPYERDMTDFLTFGNSLQVKGTQLLETLLSIYGNMDLGGILTVADDLLKNDGKRFIEMMEQLAERRMAREEDAREHFTRGYGHPNGSYSTPHNHPPLDDDDDYEDEEDDEDDYEDSQDEEYEDEEVYSDPSLMPSSTFHTECCCQDQMTEEQRMEEGRRMFQIFAARMFEQRVLSAYKEKVAKERQDKLLEELEEESRQVDQQKAKKAKNAQKKKDKAAQKKQALAEEKARKDAEKAAEDAARVEHEQKRLAEQKQKAEEKRKQKEAQKKAEEEARLKKEAERQRRIHEQREKQAEQERKAREAKEREKKLKDEQRLKEKQAREQREREAQERRDKQDRDKREKEARAAKALRDSHESAQGRDRAKDDKIAPKVGGAQPFQQPAAPVPVPSKRGQQQHYPGSMPTVLPQHPPNPANFASPKVPIATPAVPKAPTPMRNRTLSQQQQQQQQHEPGQYLAEVAPVQSHNSSPHSNTPIQASPGPVGQDRKVSTGSSVAAAQYTGQPVSPNASQANPLSHTPPFQVPGLPMQAPPGLTHQQRPPGFASPVHDPMFPLGFRPSPNMAMPPPGISGPGVRNFAAGPLPPPGFSQGASDPFPMAQGFSVPKDTPPAPSHARQNSLGYDGASMPSQPIGRPAPIGRPGSLSQGQPRDEDGDTKHLGSRALLDDDEPLPTETNTGSMRGQPPGLRGAFGASPFLDTGAFPLGQSPWGPPSGPSQPFAPPGFANPTWGSPTVPPGYGVASPGLPSMRTSSQPRHVALRLMLCQACKEVSASLNATADGFSELSTVKGQIDAHSGDPSITEQDLLNLCDTEGNSSNGGGTFEVRRDLGGPGKHGIRWAPEANDRHGGLYRSLGAPGEIGSPLTGHASLRGI